MIKLIINKFKTLDESIVLLESETRKLKDLRDRLLPMLMNGQITIE